MKITPGSIVSDGHVVLTGPIQGSVTLDDGTVVDVSPVVVEVSSPEEAAELADKIGQRYAEEGHPDDVELDTDEDSETFGQMVQREFVYVAPDEVQAHLEAESETTKD